MKSKNALLKIVIGLCLLILNGMVQAQPLEIHTIGFTKADSIASIYPQKSIKNLPLLAYQLTTSLNTETEKFRAIYTWVCTNITFDYNRSIKNAKELSEVAHDSLKHVQKNTLLWSDTLKKLATKQKTVCTGYAYLIKTLANFADIECEIVNGYSRMDTDLNAKIQLPNHSWNAVKLNKQWYLCDATWSSGYFQGDDNTFIHAYHDGYFLANPKLFIMDHYPEHIQWALLDTPPSFDQFLQTPYTYIHAFGYDITPITPNTMHLEAVKGQVITLTFQTPQHISKNKVSIELRKGSYSKHISPKIKYTKEGKLCISFVLQKKGNYDLHFKIGKEYVFSYDVKIQKNALKPEIT